MLIKKKNILSGEETTLDIDITAEQYERVLKREELIQNIIPGMDLKTREIREFLISGIPPGEFDKLFPPYQDDNDEELDYRDCDEEDNWC
jgi:hypothetical protein